MVFDLGTGTGILALLACQLGMLRVYAIEADDAIQVQQHELACANGYADRIHFLRGHSREVELPERVDVLVSDLHGALPLFGQALPSLIDAGKHFLKKGGTVIPERDELWAGVVEAEDRYTMLSNVWEDNRFGLDISLGRRFAINSLYKAHLRAEQMLSQPALWGALTYPTFSHADLAGEACSTPPRRSGTAHGLASRSSTTLTKGASFSDAPETRLLVYGQLFLPFSLPVPLEPGDRVTVAIQARLVNDDYVWRWDTSVLTTEAPRRPKVWFRQNSLLGRPVSPSALARRARRPCAAARRQEQKTVRLVLGLMDGRRTLGEIARLVSQECPGRFPTWLEALAHIGELSDEYSLE